MLFANTVLRRSCLLVLTTLLAACSSGQAPDAGESRDATATETAHPDGGVSVSEPWTRAMAPGAKVAGGFMTLRNGGDSDDRLVSIDSPAAARVEIHEMRMDDGMMRMRWLDDGLPLPVGRDVPLRPGGYHLMFIEPGEGFVEGGEVPATLVFEHADKRKVVFKVMALGATSPEPEGGEHEDRH